MLSQAVRNEMIAFGSYHFPVTNNLPSVTGERSIVSRWSKSRLANQSAPRRHCSMHNEAFNAVSYGDRALNND